jgi:hypothetical protein
MAILSPSQIHAVLKEEAAARSPKDVGSLTALLEKHNLTPDDVLMELRNTMVSGQSDSTRQRAIETSLRLNGLLDTDQNRPDFHVTINILDSEFSGMNPILLPR